ncbi:hypothetical protein QRX50_34865 [Amycolatopsis carbonis]|uniref:Uncharacterized protein n=1 Tax=Amycolatopsis carbonis TaxID=715471 RepID=A0A9Y2MT92_9PSEU|nr:hypothetical protein [Amycolatopsis sp. 2-15]WIX76613.1 hypothetical protein QRX50_34865 [Amycolatopsis sp. 2-15]
MQQIFSQHATKKDLLAKRPPLRDDLTRWTSPPALEHEVADRHHRASRRRGRSMGRVGAGGDNAALKSSLLLQKNVLDTTKPALRVH